MVLLHLMVLQPVGLSVIQTESEYLCCRVGTEESSTDGVVKFSMSDQILCNINLFFPT